MCGTPSLSGRDRGIRRADARSFACYSRHCGPQRARTECLQIRGLEINRLDLDQDHLVNVDLRFGSEADMCSARAWCQCSEVQAILRPCSQVEDSSHGFPTRGLQLRA